MTKSSIAGNFLWLSIAEVLSKAMGFAVTVYLARMLTPGNFGRLNFAFAIVTYALLLPNMGLSTLAMREVSRAKENASDWVGSILALRIVLSVMAFALLFLFTLITPMPLETKHLIIIYGLMIFTYSLMIDWAFQGIERMSYGAISIVLINVFYVGLTFLFIDNPSRILFIPVFYLIGNIAAVIFLFVSWFKVVGRIKLRFDAALWKKYIISALPLSTAFLMGQIFFNIDTVMLGFMRTDEEVGFYSAAYKVVLLFMMVSAAFHSSIFPAFSSSYEKSRAALKNLSASSLKLMVLFAIPLSVGGTMMAPAIMNFIYGDDFREGITAFQILIWAGGIFFVGNLLGRGLIACNRQDKYLKIISIQGALNIALNLVLIPSLGIAGAGAATVACECVGLVLYYREFSKIVSTPISEYLIKPLAASLIMGIVMWFLISLNVFIIFLAGAATYFAALYFIDGFTRMDIRLLKDV